MEIYAATAIAGLVMVRINFRLVGAEIRHIVEDGEAKALIVEHDLVGAAEDIRNDLSIAESRYVHFGSAAAPRGYRAYAELIAAASARDPMVSAALEGTWALIYTSGTTGRPKGVMRSHGGFALHNLATPGEPRVHPPGQKSAGHAHVPCQFAVLRLGIRLRGSQLVRLRRPEL
jgi:acyl-coenzyme A synthetase/AMP-(fatty) acid ligase